MKEYAVYIKGRVIVNAKNKDEALEEVYERLSDVETENDDLDVVEIVEIWQN